ncbi:hypothetical protein [Ketogulonicigenium vulgare]|uniref:Uncharacterized protein n=1 Tax=Ketogulonicigenium vulgare (strain WSH-001) TaxID=759362 RepID=F9Y4T6_KETVW|nr:hypothetical protein [Ketogulonicigenium vulgare]ADO43543.1 conserved hypothetical protein [Ketogulonicigenium vulgare Y25]AEM41820.1 hypothetical protein KVU_1981 [Ketogulonicigenium vulgare WSH-001]ALJ81927.1 hypothetical protein KVH_12585 [Ketogulonicigenium vulgare]AOZ55578.1 hypothetical protein KVC_2576 [Ketogulonicigenium vulgare]
MQTQIVSQLTAQGFTRIEVDQTLLGRLRFRAWSDSGLYREIVIVPATGEILRDYMRSAASGAASIPQLFTPDDGGSGSAGGLSSDDDDDDDDDDSDDDSDDDDDD